MCIRDRFWTHWSSEYLDSLQHRNKWESSHKNLNIGDLVLVQEDNLPPLKWELAHIVQLQAGTDGLVHVASVKASSGIFKLPVARFI